MHDAVQRCCTIPVLNLGSDWLLQRWADALVHCRMEGFKEPWESAVHKGRLVPPDKTLQDCGLASGSELITVRRVLVPESEALAQMACGLPA